MQKHPIVSDRVLFFDVFRNKSQLLEFVVVNTEV